MARSNDHGESSQYVSFPDPRYPVTFREAPFYNEIYYRRDFRDQHPVDPGYGGGHWIPPHEQELARAGVSSKGWRYNGHGHRYGFEQPVHIVEHPYQREPVVESTVKLYAPQLCCDNCEHRVVEALKSFPDVRNVVTDQWEKTVVVVGENLCPEKVLRYLQRVSFMDRSVFWQNR